jgi:hypothetical protein
MRTLFSGSLVIFGLLTTASSAFAQDSFSYRGYLYTCPGRCLVTFSGTGVMTVRDSGGGEVTKEPYRPTSNQAL